MLRQKITRKLTLILFALLVVLIGSAITMQFLFVSRFHTTTDYTRRRMETIQERTPLLHQRGLSGFHKKDREKIDRLLTAFGKENSASCLLLDNNGAVLGQFSFEDQLSGQFVSYAQKLLHSGKIYDDAEKPFRIQNGLHFPTRYVGLWDTMFLHDWETDGVAYLIVISKEVHTVRDYWVFARFALFAMGATVLVSCVVGKLTGARIDGWTGLCVALFILWSGIGIAKDTIDPLLGMAPDEHLVRQITDLLLAQDKVLGVHDLMIHDYGPGRRFASAHVEMDYREDVLDAHERIDELERQVRRELGVELVIHYDPIVTDDEELTRIHARVAEILKGVDPQLAVHDFRMVRGSRHTNVIFDMVLPFSMENRKQELRELVERELQTDGKQYHAVITFDMQAFNEVPEKSVSPEKT